MTSFLEKRKFFPEGPEKVDLSCLWGVRGVRSHPGYGPEWQINSAFFNTDTSDGHGSETRYILHGLAGLQHQP